MQDYRVEAEVSKDGSVTVKGIPFQAGDRVEVIIRGHTWRKKKCNVIPCVESAFDMLIHSAALQKTSGKLLDDHS